MEDPSKNLYICTNPSPERTHARTHTHTYTLPPSVVSMLAKTVNLLSLLSQNIRVWDSKLRFCFCCLPDNGNVELDLSDPPGYKLSEHTHEHYIVVIELF